MGGDAWVAVRIPRLSKIYSDSKILILQDLPRFQVIDFPRCTIIIQDFKDSQNWFSKMYHNNPRFSKIPRHWFYKMYKGLLRFQDHQKFTIYWGWSFSKSLSPMSDPTLFPKNHFHLLTPSFPTSSTLIVSFFDTRPFRDCQKHDFLNFEIYKKNVKNM